MAKDVVLYVWEYDKTNTRFNRVKVIDTYTSLIWINVYCGTGNFELYISADEDLMTLLNNDKMHVITRAHDPETAMKVEKLELQTDDENGDHLIVTGRSLECMLEMRVFLSSVLYQQTTIQAAIVDAYYNNFMYSKSEDYAFRIISIMDYDPNLDTAGYIQPVANAADQFNTESILTAITSMCESANYGFRLAFSPTKLRLYLYVGTDRSGTVVFSPGNYNLSKTSYVFDMTTYFNLCQALGDGSGSEQYKTWTKPTDVSGIDLIEKSVESGISKNGANGEIPDAYYLTLLRRFATKERNKAAYTKKFDADILDYNAFTYGVDYNLGDIVSADNGYGVTGTARVTEISEVIDESGYKIYPTLGEWSV